MQFFRPEARYYLTRCTCSRVAPLVVGGQRIGQSCYPNFFFSQEPFWQRPVFCNAQFGLSQFETHARSEAMDSIIYLVGLVVILLFILSALGLR